MTGAHVHPRYLLAAGTASLVIISLVEGCRRPDSPPASLSTPERRQGPASPTEETIHLFDVTSRSGIDFVHTDGSAGQRLIVEAMSCGLALFDYDGDQLIDIYFCNGAPLGRSSTPSPGHALYQNLGGLRFRNVTEEAGVQCASFGLGVTIGDYDNDGCPDIYLSNFGPNVLYRNNGDGTFHDVTHEGDVGLGERVGAGVCFLDVDNDGDLDLFAGNYVQLSLNGAAQPAALGRTIYPGPFDFPPGENVLLLNENNGNWTKPGAASGIGAKPGTAMGTISWDFDSDGDLDIYVANDEMANFLYQNDGQGIFTEVAVSMGAAFDAAGFATGSMGVDCGDLDNDGRRDLFVTSYQNELVTLYRNTEHEILQDITLPSRAGEGTLAQVTWGCCIADLDNDGDRDVFVACGHLDDRDQNQVYRAPNLVLKNLLVEQGAIRFANVTASCGDLAAQRHSSRGAAAGDLDNDGDLDLAVVNSRERPTLYENRSQRGSDQHWLQLQLHGVTTNRDAVGARVRVHAGSLILVDEVHGGRGYQSHWGSRLCFGLGPQEQIDRVEISWLGGTTQVLANVAVDQLVHVVQARVQ